MDKLKDIVNELLNEGENERFYLDKLTNILRLIFEDTDVKVIASSAHKDEFGGYVYDFGLSKPMTDKAVEIITNILRGVSVDVMVKHHNLADGQSVIRILI